jgi:UDPglucose 6-dehydrogenase
MISNSVQKVGVVGLGRLGLPLFCAIQDSFGFAIGLDKNETLITNLTSNNFNSKEEGVNEIINDQSRKKVFTTSYRELAESASTIFFIVDTPSLTDGSFDYSNLQSALESLLVELTDDTCQIIISSTVFPDTISQIKKYLKNRFSTRSKTINDIVYVPETVALCKVIEGYQNPDCWSFGSEPSFLNSNHVIELLQKISSEDTPIYSMGIQEVELTKVFMNFYITLKISYANMISQFANHAGVKRLDSVKICEAIGADSRIGKKYFNPGAPYGGTCFPRDVKAVINLMNQMSYDFNIAKSVQELNEKQIRNIIKNIESIVLKNKLDNIIILGVSFKEDSDELAGSHAIDIIEYFKNDFNVYFVQDNLPDEKLNYLDNLGIRKITSIAESDFKEDDTLIVICHAIPVNKLEIINLFNSRFVYSIWHSVETLRTIANKFDSPKTFFSLLSH